MSTVLEKIREGSRLARMRLGQSVPELVPLRTNPEVRVAIVPLTEAEVHIGLKMAAQLESADNEIGFAYRDRWQQVVDLYHAIRDPDNLDQRVFSSPQELAEELDHDDINHLGEQYAMMMDDSSPAIDGLSDEELEVLKKAFKAIDLSVLSGKPWWHLKQFFLTLPAGQLRVRLPGSFSTLKSTTSSDENEST